MILLLPILGGLLALGARACCQGRAPTLPPLQGTWLVALAFAPQWLLFYQSRADLTLSPLLVGSVLVASQLLLLRFAWWNRQQVGFWGLGLGLGLNLLVIVLNGGLMPISPQTAVQLVPGSTVEHWKTGEPFGSNKSVILPVEQTRLWWLSDHILLPTWIPYRAALSIGDFLIALGAFWLLWTVATSKD